MKRKTTRRDLRWDTHQLVVGVAFRTVEVLGKPVLDHSVASVPGSLTEGNAGMAYGPH
jgi:hypothetical protein